MKFLSTSPSVAKLAHAGFLALALLFAQWTGIGHTIAHADRLLAQNQTTATAGDHDEGDSLTHSCLLFDAIALGAALHTTASGCLNLPQAGVPAMENPLLSWHAPFSSHFSSRAPPLA